MDYALVFVFGVVTGVTLLTYCLRTCQENGIISVEFLYREWRKKRDEDR